jgi:uncharacterized protein (TIGR00730 family)
VHLEAARKLARVFHEQDIQLIYGGGTSGIMGELAHTLVSLSGPDAVFGVIPRALIQYERAERSAGAGNANGAIGAESESTGEEFEAKFGRMTIVPDMHSRKQLMAKKVIEGGPGSGFVALSGGYGTMEELMEMTTWNQLGIHGVGVCVYNVDGFYDGLLTWIRRAVDENFVSKDNQHIIVEAKTAEEAVDALKEYRISEGQFKLDWDQK